MAKSSKKTPKTNRPNSVRIFFLDYHINWYTEPQWLMSPLDDNTQGQADSTASCIHMRVQPHAHEQILRETLLHEVLHAIWWHMGLRDNPVKHEDADVNEEEMILRLSHGMLTVQQENPALMRYLLADPTR